MIAVRCRSLSCRIRVVVIVTSAALAAFLIGQAFFVDVFVPDAGSAAEPTLTLALAVAGTTGVSLLVGFVLVAQHRESVAASAFAAGTVITVVGGIVVVLIEPPNDALWMAGALAFGQIAALLLLSRWTTRLMPGLRQPLYIGASAAAGLLGGGLLVIATPYARYFVAASAAAVSLSLVISCFSDAGSRRRPLDGRRGRTDA